MFAIEESRDNDFSIDNKLRASNGMYGFRLLFPKTICIQIAYPMFEGVRLRRSRDTLTSPGRSVVSQVHDPSAF